MDNKEAFSPADSLMVIRSMIESTRHSIRDSSHYYLLWGWATMVGCILQYLLMVVVEYKHHYYAWFVTPVALVIHLIFVLRDKKHERVKTYISEAYQYLWMAIGLAFLVLAFIFTKIGWQYSFPFYILFYGIGTAVSGALLKFRPMLWGGIVCFLCAAFAAYIPYTLQILLTAFAILVSYIIPGHLLRIHHRRQQVN
jgi:hypothetical protein